MNSSFELESKLEKTQDYLDKEGKVNTEILDKKITTSIKTKTKQLKDQINQLKQKTFFSLT